MNTLQIKRIYEPQDLNDGKRILVDRLWPRGIRKAGAHIDVWMKDIAPSPDLRRWFHDDTGGRFAQFRRLYVSELEQDPVHVNAAKQIMEWRAAEPVTLIYAAKDPDHNHAVVLRDYLEQFLVKR